MLFDVKSLEHFPKDPGVYLMKNGAGIVIYVGKANNIKARVSQYFRKEDTRPQVPYLLKEIASIETIIVRSPKEAYLLENTLIKRHKPKYNVLLKDDKSFLGIRISKNHDFPSLSLARSQGGRDRTSQFFGPYTSSLKARELFDLTSRLFRLRQCSDEEFQRRTRPCLLYQIKRCTAPCVDFIDKESYSKSVEEAKELLSGNIKPLLRELEKEMHEASDVLDFERAAECLKNMRLLETAEEKQIVEAMGFDSADVIALMREGEDAVIARLFFRKGRLVGAATDEFEHILEENDELLESYILQQYLKEGAEIPKEIVVPFQLSDAVDEILSEKRGSKCHLINAERGEKKRLLELAEANAKASFKRLKDKSSLLEKQLLDLQAQLQLKHFPRRIECYDTSHLFGSGFVAAMVLFVNGEKEKSGYRKFHIRDAAKGDDYGAMREVLYRRFTKEEWKKSLPDLIIIDGGKGHYNMAAELLSELGIVSCDLISLVKEEGRHDKGLSQEGVYAPGLEKPIFLDRHSSILLLLQRIRDEAHRFAITFHREKRSKAFVKSALDEIPGIGPKKKKALLLHFGSVAAIMKATEEELSKVKGLTKRDLRAFGKL